MVGKRKNICKIYLKEREINKQRDQRKESFKRCGEGK